MRRPGLTASSRRKVFFTLVVLTLATLVLWAAGEIVVRRLYRVAGQNTALDMMPFEPSAMLRHVWEQKARTMRIRDNTFPINSLGYRGSEFTAAKPDGGLRVIAYGGSHVFDMEVGDDDDWPRRAQDLLHDSGFPEVEVINAGVMGNVSWESIAWLLGEGRLFSPDVVVFCHQWNEFTYLVHDGPLVRFFKPFSRRDNPHMYARNGLDRWLAQHSWFYRAVRFKLHLWTQGLGAEGSRKGGGGEPPQLNDRSFEQYRLHVEQFVDLARRIGATPVLIRQARLPVPDNSPEALSRINFDVHHLSHDQLCEGFARMDRILEEVSREDDVVLVDASSELSGQVEYFVDHIHLSQDGSEAMARVLADGLAPVLEEIRSKGESPQPRPSGMP